MDNKHKVRIPPPSIPAEPETTFRLSPIQREVFGLDNQRGAPSPSPSVSLKYYDPKFECFSDWPRQDLAAFSAFLGKLGGRTWEQIVTTGGKLGGKSGLGYTPHKDRKRLPSIPNPPSEDVTLFELRVTQKTRVHGFRVGPIFFLVWLDKDHRIYRM